MLLFTLFPLIYFMSESNTYKLIVDCCFILNGFEKICMKFVNSNYQFAYTIYFD